MTIPVYPYLLALYPVVALAAENREHLHLTSLIVPVAATLAVTAGCWAASRMATADPHRRGLFTLLGAMLVTWYGTFAGAVWGSWLLVPEAARPEILLPAWTFLIVGPAWLFHRSRRSSALLTRGLNVFAALFLLFPIVSIAVSRWNAGEGVRVREGASGRAGAASATPAGAQDSLRDVYFIVLDKYSGTSSLARNYGYDNRAFENRLRERGFLVPANPRTNYVHTAQSLASMLNWTYLDRYAAQEGGDSGDRTRLYDLIEESRALRFFESRGYTTVFLPSSYPGTGDNRLADQVLRYADHREGRSIAFRTAWLSGTIAGPLQRAFCGLVGCEPPSFPYPIESAAEIEWKLEHLGNLPEDERPLFVFAHLLVPHEPYVFEADCDHRDPYWPLGDHVEETKVKKAYTAQIECVNRLLLGLIDRLREGSGMEPVVVLQSDHGHARMATDPLRGANEPLEDLSPTQIEERIGVFAAYRLPGAGDTLLYDGITPVNVLPAILNHYFGADIPRLPDRTYWLEFERPYEFTRVR